MIVLVIVVAITWAVYGIIAGLFLGSKTFLTWLGWIMVMFYAYLSFLSLLRMDWTIIIGIPSFCAGVATGMRIFAKRDDNN